MSRASDVISDRPTSAPLNPVADAGSTIRRLLISLAATIVFVSIVLVSAGRFSYWQAWVYGALSLGLNIGQQVILRFDSALAKERAKPGANARTSDKLLLGINLVLTLAMLVTAGLQFRFSPALSLPVAWFVVGLGLNLVGAALFLWSMRVNTFFSAVVRIQVERQHVVCTTGPYRFVRHPGNLGMIIGTLGLPLLFQSSWSFIPAGLAIIVLVLRTKLEDDFLSEELVGYRDYRKHTCYRLAPGVW